MDSLFHKKYGGYGWEEFILSSKEEKMKYLATQLNQSRIGDYTAEYKKIKNHNDLNCALDDLISKYFGNFDTSLYVDHQSQMLFPLELRGSIVSEQYVKALIDFFQRDDVVIIGGNDNDGDEVHQTYIQSYKNSIHANNLCGMDGEDCFLDYRIRYDEKSNTWTTFSKRKGTKARFILDELVVKSDSALSENDIKASTPELVDLKITNYCAKGCKYCYQNSNKKGKHASLENIQKIIETFKEMNVFEVALGGGEPTSHPDFQKILKLFYEADITANFTTRNSKWIKQNCEKKSFNTNFGALAFSVDDNNIEEALEVMDFNPSKFSYENKINFQIVDGTISEKNLVKLLDDYSKINSKSDFTFLGFKEVGRGELNPEIENKLGLWKKVIKEWPDWTKQKYLPSIGIDTMLASQNLGWLIENNIPGIFYSTKEGIVSMYVDMVDGKCGQSSYIPDDQMTSFDLNSTQKEINQIILETFEKC